MTTSEFRTNDNMLIRTNAAPPLSVCIFRAGKILGDFIVAGALHIHSSDKGAVVKKRLGITDLRVTTC